MFPISSSQVPTVLRNLLEYARLSEELQHCPDRDCLPCRQLRDQRLRLQYRLPTSLLQHFHRLLTHPPCGRGYPLSIITTDGLCENCDGYVPTAWLPRIRLQNALYICENCGAILIPFTEEEACLPNLQASNC